jgi:hypothetical protein
VNEKIFRYSERATSELRTAILAGVAIRVRITTGGERSHRREELEPYHRTVHRATCRAIDRGVLAGVRRPS